MAQTDASDTTDSSARHFWTVAALVCAVATLLLAYPALGGGFLVNTHSDQYIAGYSFREFAAQSLRAGHGFPLWNPYQFGGMPFVAAMHGDIFYPTFLLRLVLPTDVAMTWGFILHMFLAGIFTVAFLRAVGVNKPASLIGGVAYLLAGPIASYASPGHDGKLFVSTLLPAALWCLVCGVRDGRRAAWGWLALVVGLAMLSPHPQLLQYMLLTAGAFTLFTALSPLSLASAHHVSAIPRDTRQRAIRVGMALGAVLLGAAIGAIQYLPVLEYVPWSPRAGGKGYEHAISYSFPLEETINTYLPQFSGILDNYWGRNGIHFHSEYLGAAVLLLAGLAFGGGMVNRHRRHAWFWLGTFIVALFWAWGGNTPFYQLVYAVVPGAAYFRAPSTILYVVSFAIAVLAAFGAERVLSTKVSTRYLVAWTVFALLMAIMATSGGFTSFALSLLGAERADAIEANATAVVVGAWRSAFFVIACAAIPFAMARGTLKTHHAGWALLAVITLDLWSIERSYWMFSKPAAQLYASDQIIDYLKQQPEPGRVIALPLSENMAPHDPFVRGDALMAHQVRGVLGYHGNELGRYQQLYGIDQGFQSLANPNFWSLTNSKFFYTNVPEPPFPGSKLVVGPVRNAAGTMTYLYRLPGEQPVAWVVPSIVKADDQATLATVLNPQFNVKRAAIFDTAATVHAKPANSSLPEPLALTVSVSRLIAGAIDLTISGPVPAGAALVVSENYYPGWTAMVDGKPAAIGRADYSLIGVELPAMAKSVTLRFDSAPYHKGKAITLTALAMAVLLIAAGAIADRRTLA